jgi:hypothetical protein
MPTLPRVVVVGDARRYLSPTDASVVPLLKLKWRWIHRWSSCPAGEFDIPRLRSNKVFGSPFDMRRFLLQRPAQSSAAIAGLYRDRFVASVLAMLLLAAQISLSLHALHHFIAEPDEHHHCPACKLADHASALPAVAAELTPQYFAADHAVQLFVCFVPALPRPSLPRGPPAVLA